MNGKQFIDNVSFEYSNIDNLNIKDVIRCCEDYNLAIIKNYQNLKRLAKPITPQKIIKISSSWSPYRSVTS